MSRIVLGVNPSEKKAIIKYPLTNNEWVENNIYSFLFDESKYESIQSIESFIDIKSVLNSYNGLEIVGTFMGYSKVDNKSIWMLDILQLNREIILNKLLWRH
jgi:hypothetical protein